MFEIGACEQFNNTDMVLYLVDVVGDKHVTFFRKSNKLAYFTVMEKFYWLRLEGRVSLHNVKQMEKVCQRLMDIYC